MKKHLIACCMFLGSVAFTAAAADNASQSPWWTYLADYKGTPGVVLVDMSQVTLTHRKQFPFLITAGTTYQGDSKSQLPTPEEYSRLGSLSRQVLTAMASHGRIVHAGTFTHKGDQVLYFYAEKPAGFEAAFTKVMTARCAGCKIIFNVRPDPQWDAYRDFLYPNAATLKFYNNRTP
jgi:hypothetical protein